MTLYVQTRDPRGRLITDSWDFPRGTSSSAYTPLLFNGAPLEVGLCRRT
jgi:hypothetical protein